MDVGQSMNERRKARQQTIAGLVVIQRKGYSSAQAGCAVAFELFECPVLERRCNTGRPREVMGQTVEV